MVVLQGVFGSVGPERTKGLFVALGDMQDDDMALATKRLIKTFRPTSSVPFPVPADFYDAAGKSTKHYAQELMGLIQDAVFSVGSYRSVDFGSAEMHGVIQRFGGWPTICQWGQREWDINEGRFLSALEHAIECGDRGPEYLAGIAEAHNGNRRYAGLCHIGRAKDGHVPIKSGLHPSTKFLPRSAELKIADELVDRFDMKKALSKSAA